MKKKSKPAEKSPFRGFSLKEVHEAEQSSFIIQVGRDLYNFEGTFSFDEEEADKHYHKLLASLRHMIKTGDEEEKREALTYLGTLKIRPLRLN